MRYITIAVLFQRITNGLVPTIEICVSSYIEWDASYIEEALAKWSKELGDRIESNRILKEFFSP